MDLIDVTRGLGLPESGKHYSAGWGRASAAMPDESLCFLRPEFVRKACDAVYLQKEIRERAISVARRVASDKALRALAWYCHWFLFLEDHPYREVSWPLLESAFGAEAGMFNVLVLLSGVPRMRNIHERANIPRDIVRSTVLDLKLCLETEDYALDYGCWGISTKILNWLLWHWSGRLYRLGRLQFAPNAFFGKLRAYRQERTGKIVALSEPGIRYRKDGCVDGAGGVCDRDGAWTAYLNVTPTGTEGCPIDHRGHAVQEGVRLAASEWRLVLAPGDPVLDIHIPSGAPLDHAECGRSIRRSLSFFARYFPEISFTAFACSSWVLDPQLSGLLPPACNTVRFQKEMYLFPVKGDDREVLSMVFENRKRQAGPLPRKTTMQRAFADHLDNGGHFNGGGCFLRVEDLEWGCQVYRKNQLLGI